MKKIIQLLILVFFLWGCGSSDKRAEAPIMEFDSTEVTMAEELYSPPEYTETTSEEHIAQIDSQRKRFLDAIEDSISIEPNEKRPFEITQLDTASLLPEIRRNKEVINQQQMILDSLLKKK